MTGGDVRLLDARWLVYRAFCRWQLGELQPRWIAVQFMGTVESGWLSILYFAVTDKMGVGVTEMPPMSFFLVVFGVLYPINWWLVFPEKGRGNSRCGLPGGRLNSSLWPCRLLSLWSAGCPC